ncbi:MAG: hypothetical protein WD269_06600 [Acidimicrobiia bacterium]
MLDAVVKSGDWSHRVRVATRFLDRLTGLSRAAIGDSLLIRARSVHGFGMRHPLLVVGIDSDMTVIGLKTLRPRRVVGFREAIYLLELPIGSNPPSAGSPIEIVHG